MSGSLYCHNFFLSYLLILGENTKVLEGCKFQTSVTSVHCRGCASVSPFLLFCVLKDIFDPFYYIFVLDLVCFA